MLLPVCSQNWHSSQNKNTHTHKVKEHREREQDVKRKLREGVRKDKEQNIWEKGCTNTMKSVSKRSDFSLHFCWPWECFITYRKGTWGVHECLDCTIVMSETPMNVWLKCTDVTVRVAGSSGGIVLPFYVIFRVLPYICCTTTCTLSTMKSKAILHTDSTDCCIILGKTGRRERDCHGLCSVLIMGAGQFYSGHYCTYLFVNYNLCDHKTIFVKSCSLNIMWIYRVIHSFSLCVLHKILIRINNTSQ